ncbi:hypothetical protein FGO68_gene15703 [Halteria grandinella]|uniref:RING-type domain-containing protein n=1 Tax=Halteria grandinella TaxID=5974 RepID=A0A8J8NF34_HALGN|nr:hypothetical protein FGO68_gene15703 [Halteria grandinella]
MPPRSKMPKPQENLKPRELEPEVELLFTLSEELGPRKLDYEEILGSEFVSTSILDQILELLKCPICLDLLDTPARIRQCGHLFCTDCVEKYSRIVKPPQCSLCRNNLISRRDLRRDHKLAEILSCVIVPEVKTFKEYMALYMKGKSDRHLFKMQGGVCSVAERVSKRVNKVKRKKHLNKKKENQLKVSSEVKEKERVKDAKFFKKVLKRQKRKQIETVDVSLVPCDRSGQEQGHMNIVKVPSDTKLMDLQKHISSKPVNLYSLQREEQSVLTDQFIEPSMIDSGFIQLNDLIQTVSDLQKRLKSLQALTLYYQPQV